MTEAKNIIKPDYLSQTTQQLAIGLLDTDTIFSTGSGFIYEYASKFYLITNWHNVTGRNPQTGKSLSDKHAGIPNVIIAYFRSSRKDGSAKLVKLPLYDDKEMKKPVWLIHPTHKQNVDVVAIELDTTDDVILSPINKANFEHDINPEVGDECFVLGYPFSNFRYLGFPIWKKANIATEPTVNEDQLPKLLIDTATRAGLSGSPVIWQRTGIHKLGKNGVAKSDSIIGQIRNFLGVYSGRIGEGEIHAQLGIVWKGSVIDEIITSNFKSDIEFQKKA